MFSRLLVKLVDRSITPALVLFCARIISVVVIARYFEIPFTIGASGFIFPNDGSYIQINSYSVFSMIIILVVGLLYISLKSVLFHETHIKPDTSAKLFSLRMSALIQSSFDLYTQGAIWLSYCYLLMFTSGLMAYFGLMYAWVFYVTIALCILASVVFILDVENEIKISKNKSPVYDDDEEYLDEPLRKKRK